MRNSLGSDHYQPINICMNPKFTAKGFNVYVLEQLSQYHDPIYATDYQNYINENVLYPSLENITEGMLFELRRKLKILICICMYNQPRQALELTLKGIYANLTHLNDMRIQEDQVAVVLMQDGILKCDSSIVDFYAEMDYQKNKCALRERIQIIKEQLENGKKQERDKKISENDNFPQTIPKKLSLLYQNKWKPDQKQFQKSQFRLNLFSCFKHLNGKKLSSHAWFFQGFCRYLLPQYCVLLDVGTVPDEYGVCNLIKGMNYDQKIGGVSGFLSIDSQFQSYEGGVERVSKKILETTQRQREPLIPNSGESIRPVNATEIRLQKQWTNQDYLYPEKEVEELEKQKNQMFVVEKSCFQKIVQCMTDYFFSVEKAQEVEYIYAHMLDKNTESFTGFLHVLPGAWSAYRMSALQTGEVFQKDLLQKKYFKTIINPDSEQGQGAYKFANMYLAEDRILSLGIYCQANKDFYLKYIPNARAKTDPMKSHFDLIIQRRRWINSSNFAFQYVNANHQFDFTQSSHGGYDYIYMKIGMYLARCAFLNTYLIPCFYLFVLYSTIQNNGFITDTNITNYLALFLSLLYVVTVVVAIGGSLIGNLWIKQMRQIVQVNRNGETRKKMVPQNGPAIYISVILTFFTYLLLFTVTSMVVSIMIKGLNAYKLNQQLDTLTFMVLVLIVVNVGSFILILLMHLPTHPKQVYYMLRGYLSYLSYQGTYTHTMLIFSFCNVDDVSWGTKGAGGTEGVKKYERQKMFFISNWIFWNTILCFIFFFVDYIIVVGGKRYILVGIAIYASTTLAIRVIFAVLNHIKYYLCCCFGHI